MSSASGSISGSLPENLGVGRSAQYMATAKASPLSPQQQDILNRHLAIVKQLLTSTVPPTIKELEALSAYTKDLIERQDNGNIVSVLNEMIKNDKPSNAEKAINAFACFVRTMSKGHVEVSTISEKLKQGNRLTYAECRLIDLLSYYDHFAQEMIKAGIHDNTYFNRTAEVLKFARENAFKDFNEGDILFYDLAGRMHYMGPGPGFLENLSMKALGTNYAHVGVFYRSADGSPCVAQVQGHYSRAYLTFGQMSFIKALRINPAKFVAKEMTEADRQAAQKKIGGLITTAVGAAKDKILTIGITYPQQAKCILSHVTSEPNTKLGKVKMSDNTYMLCSELAGISIMDAFDEYNKEEAAKGDKANPLKNPFSEYENMQRLHPVRLLNNFGPHNSAGERIESGWEPGPKPSADIEKLLPFLPAFPDVTSANPQKK